MARRLAILATAAAFVFAASSPAWAVPDPNVPFGIFKGGRQGMDISINKFAAPNVANHTINQIILTFTGSGTGLSGQSLWMELTGGAIYQENSTLFPGQNVMFDQPLAFPTEANISLQDDTFLHTGDAGFGDALGFVGAASQLYPNSATSTGITQPADSVGTTGLNLAGVDLSPNGQAGAVVVGQITLSNTANGFWEYGAITNLSDLQVGQGLIMNGMMTFIPLPGAAWMGVSLLGGMGMLRLIRRKKS